MKTKTVYDVMTEFQIQIMKDIKKDDYLRDYVFSRDEKNVYIVKNGALMLKIPECLFFLDYEKLTKNKTEFKSAAELFKKTEENYIDLQVDCIREYKAQKLRYADLIDNAGTHYAINEKFIKVVDHDTLQFKSNGTNNTPILVNDFALILPIKVN